MTDQVDADRKLGRRRSISRAGRAFGVGAAASLAIAASPGLIVDPRTSSTHRVVTSTAVSRLSLRRFFARRRYQHALREARQVWTNSKDTATASFRRSIADSPVCSSAIRTGQPLDRRLVRKAAPQAFAAYRDALAAGWIQFVAHCEQARVDYAVAVGASPHLMTQVRFRQATTIAQAVAQRDVQHARDQWRLAGRTPAAAAAFRDALLAANRRLAQRLQIAKENYQSGMFASLTV